MEEQIMNFGGYNADVFLNLSHRERLNYSCIICGYILNEPQQCINGHLYCLSCIGEWKKRGNKACPACGADASVGENNEIELTIGSKYVRCVFDCCQWKGRLERLNHHVVNSHGLSNESHVNSSCESLYSGDSLERHKQMQEIIRSQFMKKDAIIRRIKKMEKRNKRRIFGRESAKTEVPEPVISRTEIFRPFSDIVTINLSDTTPQVRWPTIDLNKDNFNQGRLKSLDVTKFIRRENTHIKMDQLERRKQNEMKHLFSKIENLERQREENRQISEQRIAQIESKMREGREAFERRLQENETRHKTCHDVLKRRVSVIRVKMKK